MSGRVRVFIVIAALAFSPGCVTHKMRDIGYGPTGLVISDTSATETVVSLPFSKASVESQGLDMSNKTVAGDKWRIKFGQQDVKTEGGDPTALISTMYRGAIGLKQAEAAAPPKSPVITPELIDAIADALAARGGR